MLKILRSRFLWPMPLLIAASNISSAFHCSFRFLLYFFFGFYFVPSVFTMFSHFNVNKLSLFSPVFNKRFERIKILSKSHYRMQFIMPFMSQVYSPTIRYTNCWTTNTEWRMHDRKHKFLHYRQLSNKKHNTLKWDEKNEHGNFSAQQIECDQKIREIKKYTWHGTWIEEEKRMYIKLLTSKKCGRKRPIEYFAISVVNVFTAAPKANTLICWYTFGIHVGMLYPNTCNFILAGILFNFE